MKKCEKCGLFSADGDYCDRCGGLLVEDAAAPKDSKLKNSMGRSGTPSHVSVSGELETETPLSRLKVSMGSRGARIKRTDGDAFCPEIVQFQRSPRLREELPEGVIEIAPPPSVGTKPEINWLATFLPTAVTIGIAIVITSVFGNPMMLLYTLPMTLAGVVVSVVNYQKQTKKYNEQVEVRQKKYDEHIAGVVREIEKKRKEQLTAMLLSDPETRDCIEIVEKRKARLWERRPDDPDFACVRIGSGSVDFSVEIAIPKESLTLEEDTLTKKPRQIQEEYETIADAPIICSLCAEQICGVVGTHAETVSLIKNMIVQLATHHCYTEMKMICVLGADDKADLKWLKDLPHFQDDEGKGCCVAATKDEAKELFRHFSEVFKQRKLAALANDSYGKAAQYLPYYLFFILEPAFLEKSDPINEYLFFSRNLGLGCVMAVQDVAQLPKECSELIVLKGSGGHIFNSSSASEKRAFAIDSMSEPSYVAFGRNMKPIRCDEGIVRETLPKSYSFYEMLGIKTAGELDLKKRWQESDVCCALKAPLGISTHGVVTLNISGDDSADGPHGLVAGMTGSGKSEAIVSYLLALTTFYSPLDLSLVIIDFKGGAMCNKFRGIPHLVGSITNLADKEIDRSLKTLDAELKHRQQLLQDASDAVASHDIDNINKYTKLFKAGRVKEPMPHMLIVVDEFAELKAQYPDFLKKLVSAARIGRSLGIHLILATQKPAGQVSDQIWSNSKFRICLKVQTEQDSKEVIKSDLAAKIKEAGHAYLMVGNNERFEFFQSGYSGAPDLTIAAGKASPDCLTQFNAVVNHIAEFCRREKIEKMPDLFMEPLPEHAVFPSDETEGDAAGTVAIGIYDDPEHKTQGVKTVSLVSSNLMIIGSSQMGKTNLLQLVIRNLAERYTPRDVAIYILDFASQLLRKYGDLNHVGGVVTSAEDEKMKHLMQLLDHEFSIRKEKFAKAGVTSLAAYRELGKTDIPHIVVIIDNFTALKELYFQEDAELIRLCRDGLSVGITVVAANSQTKGISYKYLSFFDARIALYNNDSDEYGNLFDHCRETVEKIPGRCLAIHENRLLDCQAFLAFGGSLNSSVADFAAKIHARYGTQRAAGIPELPETLTTEDLIHRCTEAYQAPYSIVLGLDYETVGPVVRNVRRSGCLSLSGGSSETQSNCLTGIIRQMNMVYPGKTKVWILDSIDRMLQPLEKLPNVVKYSLNAAAAPEIIGELEQKAKARMTMLEFGDVDSIADAELLVLVINNPTVADIMNTNKTAMMAYTGLISKYKDMGICVLVCGVPNAAFISSEFYKKSSENKQFLWFDNLPALKIVSVPYTTTKKFSKKLEAGDVYLFNDTECMKLKTPLE